MLRKFGKDTRGAILVEFAICLPVVLTMYLGSYVICNMVDCNRKVTIATRALADFVSHNMSPTAVQLTPSSTSATTYLSASALVLTPYNMANATETVSLLRVCDATHAYVVWSQVQTQASNGTGVSSTISVGTPALASVTTIPSSMINSPMVPTNPDGTTGICTNYAVSNSTKTQVGQAGGYLYLGRFSYRYTPPIGLGTQTAMQMGDTVYMSPRLN
jgi:Flp pilus assembly protein TadG